MGLQIRIDPFFYLIFSLFLLIIPIDWLAAMVIAAIVHELCHGAVIRLCGGRITGIYIGPGGALLKTQLSGRAARLLTTAAGPAGSLLLCCFLRWIPRISLCGLFQGMYNLLPLRPLDGGNIVRCLVGENLCGRIEKIFLYSFVVCIIYATVFLKAGILPLLLGGTVLARALARKIPCKRSGKRVQ